MNRNTNERLLRAKEAAGYLGIAVSTLWLWNKQDKIPKPFKLTPNTTVWRHSEIQEYIQKMSEADLLKNEPVPRVKGEKQNVRKPETDPVQMSKPNKTVKSKPQRAKRRTTKTAGSAGSTK